MCLNLNVHGEMQAVLKFSSLHTGKVPILLLSKEDRVKLERKALTVLNPMSSRDIKGLKINYPLCVMLSA